MLLSFLYGVERFLGDQRASYNQDFIFSLRIGETGPAPTARDIIFEGGNGEQITQPIFGQGNPSPTVTVTILCVFKHSMLQNLNILSEGMYDAAGTLT